MTKKEKINYYGKGIGMALMSDTMVSMRSNEPFLEILKNFENPMAGITISTIFIAIVQQK